MDRNGRLKLELVDSRGDFLSERVDIYLYHQSLSETVAAREVMASKAIVLDGLRTGPYALYRLFIDPPSFRPVSLFVNISESKINERTVTFAVDPGKVLNLRAPEWPELVFAQTFLEASTNVIGFPGLRGAALYDKLDNLRKAGLLNILAKSRRTPLTSAGVVFDHVRELREIRGDRFFADVAPELRSNVRNSIADGLFREVPGGLHTPPQGFSLAGSFKTADLYGNLQVTFFTSGDQHMADIDIDDAAGIEHIFQVVRNSLTGSPTHPYDIREILLRHQEIDPGYDFILREKARTEKRRAAGRRS